MEFNKLVRDRIPDIIRAQGQIPYVRILNDAEFYACLDGKLDEEVAEFHRDRNVEELADILEVVFALADTMGCSKESLMEICDQKRLNRGGFQDRIFLISKEG